jgi:hypothetical protein
MTPPNNLPGHPLQQQVAWGGVFTRHRSSVIEGGFVPMTAEDEGRGGRGDRNWFLRFLGRTSAPLPACYRRKNWPSPRPAHIINLSLAVLRQLKRDITAEKRRVAATAAKEPGPCEGQNGLGGEQQCGSAGEESAPPQKTASKRKANELDSSRSGGSVEPSARRPDPND